jgi:hypothetical protein
VIDPFCGYDKLLNVAKINREIEERKIKGKNNRRTRC